MQHNQEMKQHNNISMWIFVISSPVTLVSFHHNLSQQCIIFFLHFLKCYPCTLVVFNTTSKHLSHHLLSCKFVSCVPCHLFRFICQVCFFFFSWQDGNCWHLLCSRTFWIRILWLFVLEKDIVSSHLNRLSPVTALSIIQRISTKITCFHVDQSWTVVNKNSTDITFVWDKCNIAFDK